MKRSPKDWNFMVKPGGGTKLPSGGLYPPYGHIGHWEITAKVTEEMGFSAPGINVLSDAAQDPDFYEFGTAAAHAQTPDEADLCGSDPGKRSALIQEAIEAYVTWVDLRFQRCRAALEEKNQRLSLYWLGTLLHGVEDLAVHQGITNGEHASTTDNPDFGAADVALAYVYARRVLDAVRNALGQEGFDRLRNHDGEGKLSFFEKHRKDVYPNGWDIDNCYNEYDTAGKQYPSIKPRPEPVRWDREVVLSQVLETVTRHRTLRLRTMRSSLSPASANPHRRFEVLEPLAPRQESARWSILVYMAGDDRNPGGIEYAIAQDLAEIKQVGSSDAVHFLVQTDDASGSASYRYRLRKNTDLDSDRLERFNGDLNTGSTKTLVDFVQWAHHHFPADRYALVLWGHGSGHDDRNVYRLTRGSVSLRTAARLAQRRLGFFSGSRKSILEQGPTRGYGYDDTAGDFLDNGELRKALLQIKEILGRKLDILGFDACLMAMIEVAYQIQDTADLLVASEKTEPGDGWWYSRAFRRLRTSPDLSTHHVVKEVIAAYQEAYQDELTLSAIDLEKIPQLTRLLDGWTQKADPADFHHFRRSALDCSPRSGDGYCDLGSLLEAAADKTHRGYVEARKAGKMLSQTVLASCGRTSGLTIYAPGNFRPGQAGSTDALYLSLNFARETGWGDFLRKVYPPIRRPALSGEGLPIPAPKGALDLFNARHVLAAVLSMANEDWLDRLRTEVLHPCRETVTSLAEQLAHLDSPNGEKSAPGKARKKQPHEERRIVILPGIMGSLLHDRSGKLGKVWIDPWNLIFGDDFKALKLKGMDAGYAIKKRGPGVSPIPLPMSIPDADDAVQIEACGVVPIIYDRLALALMHEFGPVVEYAPFDWRQPIGYLGQGLATRLQALSRQFPGIRIALVAHSMGGLVANDALVRLQTVGPSTMDSIRALIVLGTPFLGSWNTLRALRAERTDMNVLKSLGWKSTAEIEEVVQTFQGLIDLLPHDQVESLNPSLFAPGPLSRHNPGNGPLDSPRTLRRDIPNPLLDRTRAILCTTRSTLCQVRIQADGSIDYSETVGGDGTVTKRSALNGETLLGRNREVEEGHLTLPLDGPAIQQILEWLRERFGLKSDRSASRPWPAAPEIRFPTGREELIRHLEEDDALTLGDFVALISLL